MTVNLSFAWTLPGELFGEDFRESDLRARVQEAVALTLFKDGSISSAIAAEMLGKTRADFLEFLHERGIAYFDFDRSELEREWAAVHELHQQIRAKA